MAVPKTTYTPVAAPRGRLVHVVDLRDATKTGCGRRFTTKTGWRVSLKRVNCVDCQLAIGLNCRPKKARSR